MANTLWVQARPSETTTRKVVLSEYDPAHPGTHEAWIVAYEEPRVDADGNAVEPANPPIEVGDTPAVRARIADKSLVEVRGPSAQLKVDTGESTPRAVSEKDAKKAENR